MTAVAENETPAMPGTEIATVTGTVLDEYRPRIVMAAGEARELDESLRAMMKAVLHEDVDYGVIPGTGTKPTLLKPGAEKLLQWFGFGHSTEVTETERDADGTWQGVTYRCTVTKSMPDGRTVAVAMCEGYAGYDEDRFFLTAEDSRAKAEQKERANAARYERPVNPAKWTSITGDYRAPRNSVMKMAQKRALVGAALQATSASTLFTQDIEDNAPVAERGPDVTATARQVVMALPAPVRNALDQWYRAQGWPQPGQWDAEQWCAALVQAGRLSAGADSAAATGAPRATPATVTDQEWLTSFTTHALAASTPAMVEDLRTELQSVINDGRCTGTDAGNLREILDTRYADLEREAEDGVLA